MRDRLKKSEFWSAMILLVLHVAVFPIVLSLLSQVKGYSLSAAQTNLLYYSVSLLLVALLLGRYLRRSFDGLLDEPGKCISSFLLGWLAYLALGMLASYALAALKINTDNLNEETISTMLGSERGIIIAMTVFLAPLVEEPIFRGGLFCGLHPKSRAAAYIVSIALFCLYHVWQYAVLLWDASYLLLAIQYIPAAFVLCWIYERSGSVWTGVFFHMSVNSLAVFSAGSPAAGLLLKL